MLSKKVNALRLGVAAATMAGAAVVATPAAAELSASAAVANMYLWRGIDVGDGSAAVSGDLVYSMGGAYAGVWISSGDDTLGQEYDLFVGYGAELGDFTVDLSLWNYNYSDRNADTDPFGKSDDTTGELSEIILTLGYGDFSFSYYDNIAGNTGYEYYTLSGGIGKFSATLGFHDDDTGGPLENDMTHLDISYAFNDNLSFTLSKVVDQDLGKNETVVMGSDSATAHDEDLKVVVSYSLPIEM